MIIEIIGKIMEIFMMWAGFNMIILLMNLFEMDIIYKKKGTKGLEERQKKYENSYFYKYSETFTKYVLPLSCYVAKVFNNFYKEKALG